MRSATYWTWIASGSARNDECSDTPCVCWVCGGEAQRSIDKTKWLGASYTSQNRVKSWQSTRVCEPCVVIHSRTSEVPGRPPKEGKKFGGNWRNYSVLVEVVDGVPELVTASKGEKSIIREWLQRRKKGMWFAALAESGQKHVLPSAPLNAEGIIGLVQFEETTIPIGEDWSLLSAMEEALTQGVSKDAIGTGKYTVKQYQELEHAIEAFEAAHAHERGGDWFDLALFLAQKREEDGPRKKEEPKTTDGRTAAGNKSRPARSRSKPDESLGTTSDTSGASVQDSGHAGCVVFGAVPKPEYTNAKSQLGFGF